VDERRIHPLVAVPAALGVALILSPVIALAVRAPWSRATAAMSSSGAWTALRLSIVVSVCAAVASLLLGFPIAWVLARGRIRGKALLRGIVLLPIVLPPVVGGIGLLEALGRNGVMGRFLADVGIYLPFTTAGAVVAATFVSIPLLILAAEAGLRAVDPRSEGAAATLGAGGWLTFRRVTLPAMWPQLAAGLALAWARALGEFGATITFAGNLRGSTQTLPLAVYQVAETDPGAASLIALLLVAISLGVLVLLRKRLFPR
jgi:molybdate transport system permease protein